MTRTARSRVAEIAELPAPDIQIMGDSVANGGLSSGLLQDRLEATGMTVSNFSVPGVSPLFMPFILQRQLREGPTVPRYVLYAPNSAALGSAMPDRFLGRFARASEMPKAAMLGVAPSDLAYGLCCRFSYTLRYREELRSVLTRGDLGFFKTWREPYTEIASVDASPWVDPSAVSLGPGPSKTRFPDSVIGPELRRPFSVDEANRHALDRFARMAAGEGITVLWVCLPTVESVARLRGGDEFDRLYGEFLADFAERHPNVRVLQGVPEVMPDRLFLDPWHLNADGASLFSSRIADKLVAFLQATPGSGDSPPAPSQP